MTYEDLIALLNTTGIPFACHHWEDPPKSPYGVYFDDHSENFAADDIAYHKILHMFLELYITQRDPSVEGRLEKALDDAEIYWDKDAEWVTHLRMFQISYEIEV